MKHTFRKTLQVVLSAGILFNLSCCRQEDHPGPTIPFTPMPPDSKECLYFKEHSYWLYHDSITGAYDTVEVISSLLDTVNYLKHDEIIAKGEVFSVKMTTTFDQYLTLIYQLIPPLPGYGKTPYYGVNIERAKPGNATASLCFKFPYTIGDQINASVDDIMTLEYSDTSIKVFSHTKHHCYGHAKVVETYKKGIGVIRREIDNPFTSEKHIWKLVQYEVFQ